MKKISHKPPLHLARRACRHHRHTLRHTIGLRRRHAVRVRMVTAFEEHVHARTTYALGRGDWAVAVCEKKRLQVDNLLAELRHGLGQRVVLRAEELDLGLQVGKPLFLALPALERGDTT